MRDMFRLTRQVRFAVNDRPDDQLAGKPSNSYGGYPSLSGAGRYFAADVTIAGALEPHSQYLMNIKTIDVAVREALPAIDRALRDGEAAPVRLVRLLYARLSEQWPG